MSRAEQEVAKRSFLFSRLAHVGTLILSLATINAPASISYYTAGGAVFTEALAWAWRRIGDGEHSVAEEGRRRALIENALGRPTDVLATRDLRARFRRRAETLATAFEDPNYYAADEPPGPRRLRQVLQESAFWSRELYGAASLVGKALAAAILIAVGVSVYVVVGLQSAETSLLVARVGAVFLSFLVFSDVVTQALAWDDASAKSDVVLRRLQADSLEDDAAALAVFGDYCVATATTPPIPTFIYKLNRKRIEAAWRSA